MKPGYIFSAVFVVAMAMAFGLPHLQGVPPVQAADPAVVAAAPEVQKGVNPPSEKKSPAPAAVAVNAEPAVAQAEDSIPLTSVAAPDLQNFIQSLINHQPGQVVGVYVPGLFALPVLQQPANDLNYITPFEGALTQYAPPKKHGTISMLAHNYLSGRVFFHLQQGQEVILVYGDGSLRRFRVATVNQYQALSPNDPYSDFIDQADPTGSIQSFQDVYNRYYTVDGQLVFQTCIERYGDLSWGRLFVVAEPE